LLSGGLSGTVTLKASSNEVRTVDAVIAGLFLVTIIATITGNALFSIPPVLTFLFGLSIMFLVSRFMSDDSDLDPILEYIRVIEF
ncbi:MAG TPA: sodium:proton antiporter, partial [Marinobacter hydrocarbonoclasticus]|nr:sodium:proton antiporter [Marinobacter nauticus]